MWDNYLSAIRPEFWDCRNENSLVFMEGTTPFHFDPRYYKEAHQVFLLFFSFIPSSKKAHQFCYLLFVVYPRCCQRRTS
jgi:hypothetical protein